MSEVASCPPFDLSAGFEVEGNGYRGGAQDDEAADVNEGRACQGRWSLPEEGSEDSQQHCYGSPGGCMDQDPEQGGIEEIEGQESGQIQESEEEREGGDVNVQVEPLGKQSCSEEDGVVERRGPRLAKTRSIAGAEHLRPHADGRREKQD